jgi:hypothetical protein
MTIVSISFALVAGLARAEAPNVSPECQVARDLLGMRYKNPQRPPRPWVFANADAAEVRQFVHRRDLISGWKYPLSPALAARFLASSKNGPLTDCEGFGEYVTSLGGRFGKVAEEEGAKPMPNSILSAADYEAMSTPVLSSNGRRALLYVNSSCGGTCGSGWILQLARDPNGHWRILDRRNLWIA